jgi:nickel transport protein
MHVVHTLSELEIEAYFGGGASVKDGDVKVYDIDGNLYLEGTTDEEGKFRFPPKVGMEEYKVVVNATHMPGHKGETTINLSQDGAGGAGTEMPLYTRVIAGFGYLIGIAGFAMAYVYWKRNKK